MNKNPLTAMVAGHICLDITPTFNPETQGDYGRIFTPGKLINIDKAVIGTGGAVSNTGLAMARLGLDVKLNGKVGNDAFGDIIKKMVGSGRAASFKTVKGQASSYSIVLALPAIDRIFLHHPGTNDSFAAGDVDYEALAQCSLFHFGYPTLMKQMYANDGRELVEMFKRARECGVVTSLDVTLPDPASESGRADWKAILSRTLPYVDIFLPSMEEIAFMLNRDLFEQRKQQSRPTDDPVLAYRAGDCSALADELIDMGAAVVAIKNGIKGYYLKTASTERIGQLAKSVDIDVPRWSGREIWAGSYKALQFGSATGAGDATIAGFLAGFLRQFDPVACLQIANTVGWQNIRQVDTLSGIEDWPATLQMVRDKSRLRNPLQIDAAGWRFSPADQVYYGPDDRLTK